MRTLRTMGRRLRLSSEFSLWAADDDAKLKLEIGTKPRSVRGANQWLASRSRVEAIPGEFHSRERVRRR